VELVGLLNEQIDVLLVLIPQAKKRLNSGVARFQGRN